MGAPQVIYLLKSKNVSRNQVKVYRQVPRKPRLAGGDESAQSKNNQI
jgi:hypothetical protein